MKTFSHRLIVPTLLSLSLTPVFIARAQPPETAKVAEEIKKANEPQTLPLVTWDELQKQLGGPTLVTLHVKEMAIGDVIDALSKQAPVPVKIDNRSYLDQQKKPPLTLDYDAQPFWTVARDIAEKGGIGLQNYGGRNGITFTPWSGRSEGIVSATGPAIFSLTNASYGRSVGQAKEASRNEYLQLSCTMFADPKLQWQQQGMAVHLSEALDENNQSLVPKEDSDLYQQGMPLDMTLRLKGVDSKGGSLKSLRGTFHGAVAAISELWEVDDALKAKNAEKIITAGEDTTRLELQDIKPKGEGYVVTVIISQSNPINNQQGLRLSTGKRIWMQQNFYDKMRLVDDKGRDLQLREQGSNSEGDEKMRITTFTSTFFPSSGGEDDKTGAPAKFIMRYDSDWRELIIPFAFKDVKLP